jgi:hypothetical protein
MSLLEIGKTGASKQSWRSPGPRALLKTMLDEAKDPHNGKVLFKDFLAAVLPESVRNAFDDDDAAQRMTAIIEYWFTNNYASMIHAYPRPGDDKRTAVEKQKRAIKQQALREAVREKIQEKAEILLLEWAMPNGKPVGDCTGKEIRQFGNKVAPWVAKIAAKVTATQIVRDVLSETDVRKMWGK